MKVSNQSMVSESEHCNVQPSEVELLKLMSLKGELNLGIRRCDSRG